MWIVIFRDAAGIAKRKSDRGAARPTLMMTIEGAQIIDSITLKVHERNDDPNWGTSNGLGYDIIKTMENNRIRTTESKSSDGRQLIKGGLIVASGQPVLWANQCGK
jgi:hypothetical protein